MMRMILCMVATLGLVMAGRSAAQEVKFTMAAWDSPLVPLGITPYYLRVNSPTKARVVEVGMDLYLKGAYVRTISFGKATALKPQPLKVNCAVYLNPGEDGTVAGTSVMDWGGSRITQKFTLTAEEFPMKEGLTQAFEGATKMPFAGRTALFVLLAGPGGFGLPASIVEAPAANPKLSALMGCLRSE